MRHALANTAIVEIKAHIPRSRAANRATNTPLTNHTCSITRLLHHCSQCRSTRLKAHLTLNSGILVYSVKVPNTILNSTLYILANLRVTHILTRNKAGTRWRGYWCSGIHICKADTVVCQCVNIWRLGLCLTITTKIAITSVIHKDKYHIWLLALLRSIATTCSDHRNGSYCRHSDIKRSL